MRLVRGRAFPLRRHFRNLRERSRELGRLHMLDAARLDEIERVHLERAFLDVLDAVLDQRLTRIVRQLHADRELPAQILELGFAIEHRHATMPMPRFVHIEFLCVDRGRAAEERVDVVITGDALRLIDRERVPVA
ncbi:MAG: hypothetical protein ING19_16335, partial [Azospirillum sp.]|nr:hypothetical protein [Azospirillum sp.]